MASTRAAQRYAKALLDLATEKNEVAQVQQDMQLIADTINGSRELRNVLKSPVIAPEKKSAALESIFANASPMTIKLFKVLAYNKRIEALAKVAENFGLLYNTSKNIKVANVTTAVPLTAEMEKKILKKVSDLTQSEIILKNEVDASLLGGFVLRIGDLQYDASIAGELVSLNQTFNKNATI